MCQNLNIFCPRLTVGSTFNPRQYLQSFEISKQISCVLRGIKRAISRKLVKISDCRVSSFLKTFPGCRVSRHELNYRYYPSMGEYGFSKAKNSTRLRDTLQYFVVPKAQYQLHLKVGL